MHRILVLAAAAVVSTLVATNAMAHARLVQSDPRRGATVSAPRALHLTFSEEIVATKSSVAVTGPAGVVAVGRVVVDGQNKHLVLVPLPAVAPGAYKVKWTMTTEDTHTMHGDFDFSVK